MFNAHEDQAEPRLCDIETTCKLLSLSRTWIYKLLNEGELESVRIGTRRLIVIESIDAFVSSLRRAA